MKQKKLHPLVMMFDFATLISYIVTFMEISGWLETSPFPFYDFAFMKYRWP